VRPWNTSPPGVRQLLSDRRVCGPIGPRNSCPWWRAGQRTGIESPPLHFWGMDEWVVDGKEVGIDFPLGLPART